MTETLVPTCNLRWLVDYDGERVLQQMFYDRNSTPVWRRVPAVDYNDLSESERKRQS